MRDRTELLRGLAECLSWGEATTGRGKEMVFADRTEAGRRLAERLTAYAGRTDVVVLGIPRGGVPVAFEVAVRLSAPLEVFLLRKLGVPGQEELAFGAIASGGVRVLDREIVEALGISEETVEQVAAGESEELERRERVYRQGRTTLSVKGKTVIVVDDGIATGSSMRAGIRALRQLQPKKIVVAVPVAPTRTCSLLKREVDELVCLETPPLFDAIGQFYEDFSQVSDEEVLAFLERAHQPAMKKAV